MPPSGRCLRMGPADRAAAFQDLAIMMQAGLLGPPHPSGHEISFDRTRSSVGQVQLVLHGGRGMCGNPTNNSGQKTTTLENQGTHQHILLCGFFCCPPVLGTQARQFSKDERSYEAQSYQQNPRSGKKVRQRLTALSLYSVQLQSGWQRCHELCIQCHCSLHWQHAVFLKDT